MRILYVPTQIFSDFGDHLKSEKMVIQFPLTVSDHFFTHLTALTAACASSFQLSAFGTHVVFLYLIDIFIGLTSSLISEVTAAHRQVALYHIEARRMIDAADDRYFSTSIASFGSFVERKKIPETEIRVTNKISDIEGASRTMTKYERYANKPPLLQSDIPGSTSRSLTRTRNTMDNTLYIDDIEGARARQTNHMIITKRRVNPLQPEYDLPSFEPVKPYEPKFLRDTMDSSDIEGTKSKSILKLPQRDNTNKTDDIMGASSNWRSRSNQVRFERDPKEIMQVNDISGRTRYVDRTDRRTDPMNPIYEVNGMVSFDDPKYTKPRRAMPLFQDSALLRTKDANAPPDPGPPRRQYGRTNYIADIVGSEPDSIKHSITSTRVTNPLFPVYQSLDGGEALPPVIKPLMPPHMIIAPTLRPKKVLTSSMRLQTADVGTPPMSASQQQRQPESGHLSRRESEEVSKFSDTACETFFDSKATSGYYETKSGESARGGDEPVLFTSTSEDAQQPVSAHRYKLDLDIHHGNGSSRRSYSGRADTGAAATYSSAEFNTGRRISNNNNNSDSARDSSKSKLPSGRNSARGSGSSSRDPSYGGLSAMNSARKSGKSLVEKKLERERLEEINSVRDL